VHVLISHDMAGQTAVHVLISHDMAGHTAVLVLISHDMAGPGLYAIAQGLAQAVSSSSGW
jgi:hypothetical protein